MRRCRTAAFWFSHRVASVVEVPLKVAHVTVVPGVGSAPHLPSHCHVWSRLGAGQAASVFARRRERSNPSLPSRSIRSWLRSSAVFEVCVGLLCSRVAVRLRSGVVSGRSTLWGHFILVFTAPPNNCMQPTPQPVIKFAYANLPPAWCAADAGC